MKRSVSMKTPALIAVSAWTSAPQKHYQWTNTFLGIIKVCAEGCLERRQVSLKLHDSSDGPRQWVQVGP